MSAAAAFSTEPTGLLLARLPVRRRETVVGLAGLVLQNYPRGRRTVAIDGRAGTGKTGIADDLALALRDRGTAVFRASLDDFHRRRSARERLGADSAEGRYRDSYDYSTLRRVLLDPFRLDTGAGFSLRAFDVVRDAPVESEWVTGPDDAVLVVDGVYALRPELRGAWNWSAYLEAAGGLSIARASERAGVLPTSDSPFWRGVNGAWDLYEREADPRARADVIIDTTDLAAPKRVFADAC